MKSKYLSVFLFFVYLVILFWIIVLKTEFNISSLTEIKIQSINLVPFTRTTVLNNKIFYDEILYNILLFIPMGVFLSMIFENKPIFANILFGLFISLMFEIIQFIFKIGISDITDLINNTFGCALGTLVYKIFKNLFDENALIICNWIISICTVLFILFIFIIFVYTTK